MRQPRLHQTGASHVSLWIAMLQKPGRWRERIGARRNLLTNSE
jgi:hypothetical protein